MLTPATLLDMEIWKPDVRRLRTEVLRLALRCIQFSAIDLPSQGAEQGGQGNAGAAFKYLAGKAIIEPVIVGWDGPRPIQRQVRNKAGNPIGVWRLANGALARTMLSRNEPAAVRPVIQDELFYVRSPD